MTLKRRDATQIWALVMGALFLYVACSGLVASYQLQIWTFTLGHYTVTGPVALFEIALSLLIGLGLTGSSIYHLE